MGSNFGSSSDPASGQGPVSSTVRNKLNWCKEVFDKIFNYNADSDSVTFKSNWILTAHLDTAAVTVPKGGTGLSTITANGAMLGNGTSAVQVTAAGSANTVLSVPTGGGTPSFSTVKRDMLASATGSTSVSSSTDIALNDYSFFPSITDTSVSWNIVAYNSVSDPGDTIGRFRVTPPYYAGTCRVRWRYLTSSDDPIIWVAVRQDGTFAAVWVSDDPITGNVPGVVVSGAVSHSFRADDLAQIGFSSNILDVADSIIERKRLKPQHRLYRALQANTNDPAPSTWLLENCIWKNNEFRIMTAQEKTLHRIPITRLGGNNE